jgi:glycosyltransferase involved in cell wall biosynthesis
MSRSSPSTAAGDVRLAIYCDYPYRLDGAQLTAEQPVAIFLDSLSEHVDRLIMIGRLDPEGGRYPYAMPGAELVALPFYSSGADPVALLRSAPGTLAAFWRALGEADVAWSLGPTPLSVLFALLALVRGRRLVLGVRQDTPRLFAHRYPDRRLLRAGVGVLEGSYRLLSRIAATVVVGPDLARRYRGARRLHETYISLLPSTRLAAPEDDERRYDGDELRILSVGRLDPEKNPLLLADVLARALVDDSRWRLDVCGDGPLAGALAQRLQRLGVSDRARLHGHVPIDGGLLDLYRDSHVMLHVSFTEGVPQVLLEAFALRLPVVATAVGGVPGLVGDAGLLIAPADPDPAAEALGRIAGDATLRAQLVERGSSRAREHTLERESAELAAFLGA